MRIEVAQRDVTTLVGVDAIQNAANGLLQHGAGVAGAIRRAGDPVVQAESDAVVQTFGRVPPGSTAWTTAGPMPAKYVLHAVTMSYPGGVATRKIVHDCTRSTLRLAEALGCKSVALVALGTGIGGMALDECARLMVDRVTGHDKNFEPLGIERVVFCVVGDEAEQAFNAALGEGVRGGVVYDESGRAVGAQG